MNRWLAALVVALVFGSGIGVGVLGTLALQHMHGHRPPPMTQLNRGLARGLHLSAEQVEQMNRLREQHHARMETLRPRLREEIEHLHASHIKEVRAILTEEQRQQFDKMRARREARHRRGAGRRPAGRP